MFSIFWRRCSQEGYPASWCLDAARVWPIPWFAQTTPTREQSLLWFCHPRICRPAVGRASRTARKRGSDKGRRAIVVGFPLASLPLMG